MSSTQEGKDEIDKLDKAKLGVCKLATNDQHIHGCLVESVQYEKFSTRPYISGRPKYFVTGAMFTWPSPGAPGANRAYHQFLLVCVLS